MTSDLPRARLQAGWRERLRAWFGRRAPRHPLPACLRDNPAPIMLVQHRLDGTVNERLMQPHERFLYCRCPRCDDGVYLGD